MKAIIPDTIEGALILSVIDFFASFVIISGIGVVLSFFPLLNRVRNAARAVPAAPLPVPVDDLAAAAGPEAGDHVAAIAAAVFATVSGAHRIVRIEPGHSGEGWAAEGRLAHHGSHVRHGNRPPPANTR
jgi:hypothetical protein